MCVLRLVLCHEKSGDVESVSPIDIMSQYFDSVLSGGNVLHREYAYISSTPRNRISFLKHFQVQALIDP